MLATDEETSGHCCGLGVRRPIGSGLALLWWDERPGRTTAACGPHVNELEQLRTAFNAATGEVRVVLLLSPT